MTTHGTVDLADAMPSRPVVARPPQTVGPLALLGVFVLLFGLLAAVLWWLGPDLVRDWRIGNGAVAASDARIEEARCRSRLFVLRVCDVSVVDGGSAATSKRMLWYLFIDSSDAAGLAATTPMRSRSDAGLLSTSLGLEKLVSRSLALALLVAILAFCIGAAFRIAQQGLHNLRAFRNLSGQRLIPVVVEIERNNLLPPRRRLWVYLYDDDGKQGRAFIELPARQRPLFIDRSEKRALALRGAEGGMPLLLDAGLRCLDLTATEKAAFYAACRAAFEEAGRGNCA